MAEKPYANVGRRKKSFEQPKGRGNVKHLHAWLNQEEADFLDSYCETHQIAYAEAIRRGLALLKKEEEK